MSAEDTRSRLNEIADLSLKVLPEMYDEASGLFSHKTLVEGGRYVNKQPNILYSTVSLMGILRQRRTSPDSVVPIGRTLDALHAVAAVKPDPGVLGNLLCACALAEDPRAAGLVSRLAEAADSGTLAYEGMGNALHGLATAAERLPDVRDEARRAADKCARELLGCFSPGIDLFRMGSLSLHPRRSSLESQVTSFAAQIYPLFGLTAYYRFTGDRVPDALTRVADRLVDWQGPLGQWWWLYSSRVRRVVEGYPAYSVHQDGMAFIALAPFRDLGLTPYDDALGLGLNWLYGDNEVGVSLVEEDPPFIPRCIQRRGSDADGTFGLSRKGYAAVLAKSLRPNSIEDRTHADPAELEVLHECRSYHLGWALHAHELMDSQASV